MGKVTTYCQISACSPEAYLLLEYYENEYGLVIEDPEEGGERIRRTREALELLLNADEVEGQQAISIIGAFHDNQDRPLWEVDVDPPLEELLKQAGGHVRVISDWMMGDQFDLGFVSSSTDNENAVLVSFGCCFFVQSYMLPILEAATAGRVSPQRLWELAMRKGHFPAHDWYVLPGVDYGVIAQYVDQFPWYLGDVEETSLHQLGDLGRPEDIVEVMREQGFWMWMRPDRFPIGPTSTLKSSQSALVSLPAAFNSTPFEPISKLPPVVIQLIMQHLPLNGILALSMLHKRIYHRLLGNPEMRNTIARTYIKTQAPWYLPHGEAELRWWKELNGDEALGWEYLRRCWSESHSMRNRKRVWRAAESIEEQCELEEAKGS